MRRVLQASALLSLSVAMGSCSLIGDESRSCGEDEGRETLEAASLDYSALTVVEACSEVFQGFRSGERRGVVARADEAAVYLSLRRAGIDVDQGSFSGSEARANLDSFVVEDTPRGQAWRRGELLTYSDQVTHRDRDWDRYVAWGRERGGDDYLIEVILEVGSM